MAEVSRGDLTRKLQASIEAQRRVEAAAKDAAAKLRDERAATPPVKP